MEGELFEILTIALLFFRGLSQTEEFALASNVKSAGSFDDVVFVYKAKDQKRSTLFLQLKSKQKKKICCQMLTAAKGDFSLLQYFISYEKTRIDHESGNKDLQFCGPFEDIQFIIYSNAPVNRDVIDSFEDVSESVICMTGGKGYRIKPDSSVMNGLNEFVKFHEFLKSLQSKVDNAESENTIGIISHEVSVNCNWKTKNIRDNIQTLKADPTAETLKEVRKAEAIQMEVNMENWKTYFSNLIICIGQEHGDSLINLVKTEIKKVYPTTEIGVNSLYDGAVVSFTQWWKSSNEVLRANSQVWKGVLENHLVSLSRPRIERLESLQIRFDENSRAELLQKITDSKSEILFLTTKGEHIALTTLKFLQTMQLSELNRREMLFITLEELLSQNIKAIPTWRELRFKTVVVECELVISPSKESEMAEQLCKIVKAVNMRVVIIIKKNNSFARAIKLRTSDNEECEDVIQWKQILPESQNMFLSKMVNFQGQFVPLKSLIGEGELASKLEGVTLGLLLNDKLQIGRTLSKSNNFYWTRRFVGTDDPVKSVSDIPDNVVLVTGVPGIGKSTLLSQIAETTKQSNPLLWVVRINVLDCSKYLRDLKFKDINDVKAYEFVNKFSTVINTSFEEALFYHFIRTGKMVILLDGIDEVCPHYEDKILEILANLQKANRGKLWVTSRLILKDQLETKLGVKGHQLAYLTKDCQGKFLEAFWKERNSDIDLRDIETFTKSFINRIYESLHSEINDDYNQLVGIPQITVLLGELFEHDLRNYKFQTTVELESLDLVQLYRSFVRMKHEAYFKEKKNEDTSKAANIIDRDNNYASFERKHMEAAVWSYFINTNDYESLATMTKLDDKKLKSFCEKVKSGREKTGIIDGVNTFTNRPKFIHRTFCEYFVALWISENYKSISSFLVNKIFDSSFRVVKEMLTQMLCKNSLLHLCVLKKDVLGLKRLLNENPGSVDVLDEGGRTALHLLVFIWDPKHHLVFAQIALLLLDHDANVNAIDGVLKMKPLEIADRTQAWTVSGLLLQRGGDVDDMRMTKRLLHPDIFKEFLNFLRTPYANIVHLLKVATKNGQRHLVRYLLEEREGDINCKDEDGCTIMHWAAENGNTNLMSYLHKKGASIKKIDEKGNSPLHFAARGGGMISVEFLVNQGAEVNALNKAYETPLLIASKSAGADLEVVKYLIRKSADVNACDSRGMSTLQAAVATQQLDKVKCFVDNGVDINKFGEAALVCAMKQNYKQIASYLQDEVKIELPDQMKHALNNFSVVAKVTLMFTLVLAIILSVHPFLGYINDNMGTFIAQNHFNSCGEFYNSLKANATLYSFCELKENSDSQICKNKNLVHIGASLNKSLQQEERFILSESTLFMGYSLPSNYYITAFAVVFVVELLFEDVKNLKTFHITIGNIIWTVGLMLSPLSPNSGLLLVIDLVWVVTATWAKIATHGFERDRGKHLLRVACVPLWAASLIYSFGNVAERLLVMAGGLAVGVGVTWRQNVSLEENLYKVWITMHATGIACACALHWRFVGEWPDWLALTSGVALLSYVICVAFFVCLDKILPLDVKHRLAWLLVLIPVAALLGVSGVGTTGVEWIGVTAFPFVLCTMFFEWGRQHLASNRV